MATREALIWVSITFCYYMDWLQIEVKLCKLRDYKVVIPIILWFYTILWYSLNLVLLLLPMSNFSFLLNNLHENIPYNEYYRLSQSFSANTLHIPSMYKISTEIFCASQGHILDFCVKTSYLKYFWCLFLYLFQFIHSINQCLSVPKYVF